MRIVLNRMTNPAVDRAAFARVCVAAIVAAAAIVLIGCNTVKGVGRDVEAIAQGGQDIIDGKR